ncbi:hypothetical protein Sjap_020419 [Stephania japonica]|uniref:PH domain-containing protein n=1 Tax=Stephania japonica TaxID=461633 RepID=A0AAP0F0L5_9MAGN
MRVKELHPLCCISLESPRIGDQSPVACSKSNVGGEQAGSDVNVAGLLYKWTNYGKGWRCRWFSLKNGFVSYSQIRRSDDLDAFVAAADRQVLVIGDVSSGRLPRLNSSSSSSNGGGSCRRRKSQKSAGFVHLKIYAAWDSYLWLIFMNVNVIKLLKQVSSFRESKSDDRRFYIFTATKTLHLRTSTKKDRVTWLEALVSTRSLFSLRPLNDDNLSVVPNYTSLSTEKLKERLRKEGISEILIKDCEQIMLSEFSELHGQLKVLCQERSNLLDTLRQLEAANTEVEASGMHDNQFQLSKHEFTGSVLGKCSESSTTESSDEIEKLELEEVSDEDETTFFDTREWFGDSTASNRTAEIDVDLVNNCRKHKTYTDFKKMYTETKFSLDCTQIERRKKLPDPIEKEKGASLWSMIKDNVGKDLTRVCLPVYFNEPISSLQKCFEDLEYSHLLDQAYEYGKQGDSLLRILNVAAFAVSGYASSEGRHCKPFNPLLGETYEADYPEKGLRFFSEKVSHHPTLIACHCEGRGWKFWGDSNLRTKFWGRSIQLDPVGVLTLEFDDGEIFQWSKVTTTIYNLILGKIYCDHHGTMHIKGNRQNSCKLKFKEQTILDRNPRQVRGSVEDGLGNRVATLFGKWDDSIYYTESVDTARPRDSNPSSDAKLLWKRAMTPPNLTRYNLTSFAITLNELTAGLQEKLPPTDSRLRPDQRHLENGEYEKANAEKLRLERRQRMVLSIPFLKLFLSHTITLFYVPADEILPSIQGNCKKMDGSQDGFTRTVRMDLIAILVDTGKQESRGSGMDASISSVN